MVRDADLMVKCSSCLRTNCHFSKRQLKRIKTGMMGRCVSCISQATSLERSQGNTHVSITTKDQFQGSHLNSKGDKTGKIGSETSSPTFRGAASCLRKDIYANDTNSMNEDDASSSSSSSSQTSRSSSHPNSSSSSSSDTSSSSESSHFLGGSSSSSSVSCCHSNAKSRNCDRKGIARGNSTLSNSSQHLGSSSTQKKRRNSMSREHVGKCKTSNVSYRSECDHECKMCPHIDTKRNGSPPEIVMESVAVASSNRKRKVVCNDYIRDNISTRTAGETTKSNVDNCDGKGDKMGFHSPSSVIPQELRHELKCAICHETLFDPLSIPCGHSFCKECLIWWTKKSQSTRASTLSNVDVDTDGSYGKGNGNCPTCRESIPCDINRIQINTSLRTVVRLLLAEDLTERALLKRRQRIKATKGEHGGAHERGFETICDIKTEKWMLLNESRIESSEFSYFGRRSIVMDAYDATMQVCIAIARCSHGNESSISFHCDTSPAMLKVSLCLLRVEEDEAEADGIPLIIANSDDEHFIYSGDSHHFDNVVEVKAYNLSDLNMEYPTDMRLLGSDGIATFDLDLSDEFRNVSMFSFRHVETGSVYELELKSRSDRKMSVSDMNDYESSKHTGIDDDYCDADDENDNEFEDDGFVVLDESDEGGSDMDENESCHICNKHGNLIVCDGGDNAPGCGRSFHIQCVNRSIIPPGDWICNVCARTIGKDVGIEGHEFPNTSEGPKSANDDSTSDQDGSPNFCSRDTRKHRVLYASDDSSI